MYFYQYFLNNVYPHIHFVSPSTCPPGRPEWYENTHLIPPLASDFPLTGHKTCYSSSKDLHVLVPTNLSTSIYTSSPGAPPWLPCIPSHHSNSAHAAPFAGNIFFVLKTPPSRPFRPQLRCDLSLCVSWLVSSPCHRLSQPLHFFCLIMLTTLQSCSWLQHLLIIHFTPNT